MPRPEASASPRLRAAAVLVLALGAVAAAVTILSASDIPAGTYRDNDFSQYYAGARAVAMGRSPYGETFWAVLREIGGKALFAKPYATVPEAGLTVAYPLWVFVLLAPMGVLPLALAASAFLMAQLAGIVAALVAIARRLLSGVSGGALVFAVVAAAFQPLWLILVGGNLAGIVAAAFIGGVAAALSGRPRLAGGLLGLCLLKPHVVALAVLALLLGLDPRARRRALASFAVVAIVLIAIAFASDPSWVAPWWRNLTALQSTSGSNATGWTIDRAVDAPRWTSPVAVAIVLGSFVVWVRARRPASATMIAAATPVSIFAAPHAWSYDAVPLLLSVAVLIAIFGRIGGRARALGLAAIGALAIVGLWAAYALAFRRGGEEWTAVAILAFFPLVVLADTLQRRMAT